jgi:hypothetical protein
VNPLLFAAEEVLSRLYNILDLRLLGPLRATTSLERYPVETLYLVAHYFAHEVQMLRFTALAADPEVIGQTQKVRDALAIASSVEDVDPWCLFRTMQAELVMLLEVTERRSTTDAAHPFTVPRA